MYYLYVVNLVLLTLLGLSTGAVKILRMEAEMKIFRQAGFPDWATIAFGVLQIVATALLFVPGFLRVGGVLLVVTFAAATGVLFMNQMHAFGLVSVLFVAMAVFAMFPPARP